ncbi:hypothetical protein SAMN05421823_10243 [Catalinimonas alkaloidigena]|uniref:Uncharacterized protein n=1 Tax=Catalinimonas alkaloidigena TaxID=1075417 RepID=A0A1G8ZRI1_9BACT|nr:hypothetical protein [Catalinimonas alkaloidigena]SDK16760.1 hypothetical protein SAMN05421823_10243 [Catalinimonas alkaloidigena]
MNVRSFVSRFYLVQLFRQSKLLFVVILMYGLLVGRSVYNKRDTFPFFIYAMYSGYYGDWAQYEVPVLLADDEALDLSTLPYPQFDFLMSICHTFVRYDKANFSDKVNPPYIESYMKYLPDKERAFLTNRVAEAPGSRKAFIEWLRGYLELLFNRPIQHLQLRIDVYGYGEGRYVLQSSHSVFDEPLPKESGL